MRYRDLLARMAGVPVVGRLAIMGLGALVALAAGALAGAPPAAALSPAQGMSLSVKLLTSGSPAGDWRAIARLIGAGAHPTGTLTASTFATARCAGIVVAQSSVQVVGARQPTWQLAGPLPRGSHASVQAAFQDGGRRATAPCVELAGSGSASALAPGTLPTRVAPAQLATPSLALSPAHGGTYPFDALFSATMTLSGGASPSGSLAFATYQAGGCSGTAVSTATFQFAAGTVFDNFLLMDGSLADLAGAWSMRADYSGDPGNDPASSGCVPYTVSATPTDSMSFDLTGTTLPADSIERPDLSVSALTPAVSGALQMSIFTDGACITFDGSWSATVTAGPSAAADFPLTVPRPGTYSVQAFFGGDTDNSTLFGDCRAFTSAAGANNSAGDFTPLTPARLLDTRTSSGPLGPGGQLDLQVTGQGGVPATGVSAVVLNVTVTAPSAPSYLTVWPAGEARPPVSDLNFARGETLANLVTVRVAGDSGMVSLFNLGGSTQVVVDVFGFYSDGIGSAPAGDHLTPMTPARILDTRASHDPLGPGGTLAVQVAGTAGIPAGADAVAVNVTAVDSTAHSFLTLWPSGSVRPFVSNLNPTGPVVPNQAIVKLGPDGMLDVFNANGTTDVIVDVAGWFTSGPGGLQYYSMVPFREFDSRDLGRRLEHDSSTDLDPLGLNGLSYAARAVQENVAVTDTTAPSYLTVWPTGAARPVASNLNFRGGKTIANGVLTELGTCLPQSGPTIGCVSYYNFSGSTDLIVDIAGYFT